MKTQIDQLIDQFSTMEISLKLLQNLNNLNKLNKDRKKRQIDNSLPTIMQAKQEQTDQFQSKETVTATFSLEDLKKKSQQAFQLGKYQEAIQIFEKILELEPQSFQNLMNFASMYYESGQYENCMKQCKQYISIWEGMPSQGKNENESENPKRSYSATRPQKPSVRVFILYNKSIIKLKKLLTPSEENFIGKAAELYPLDTVLKQTHKTIQELQVSENEEEFMDKMFEKLLIHPKIRNFMQDQGFLTKVEKLIRNPSLAGALIKIDRRLEDVNEALLMAEDDTQGDRDNSGK